MKINSSINLINFKGYDAVPLKALHMGISHKRIEKELGQIAQKEGFDIKTSGYNESFNQDFKVILDKNNVPELTMQQNVDLFTPHISEIEKTYGMNTTLLPIFDKESGFISGGNFFIGKKPDGTKWMLIGAADQCYGKDLDKISNFYGVDKENIHFLPQESYHLDMSVRPIGYPYVLVNNPKAVLKNQFKIKGMQATMQRPNSEDAKIAARIKELKKSGIENVRIIAPPSGSAKQTSDYIHTPAQKHSGGKKKSKKLNPANAVSINDDIKMICYRQTIKALEKAGFCPIPIGGLYENGINFMNAIVNMHPDGTVSYITNSSKSTNPRDAKYQKLFEKDLKNKLKELARTAKEGENVPRLRDIYFIEGELYDYGNEMTENIIGGSGGIHCMTLEEPNFEFWA